MLGYMSQVAVNAIAEEIGDLLTVSEAAAIVRCPAVTIYRAIDEGQIKDVIRLGEQRGIRIPVDSFREYIKTRRIATSPDSTAAPELHSNITATSSPALPEPVVLAERADESVVVHAA
jgi:excisionase family DNA binding protein